MDALSLILDSMHASAALAMCFRLSAPFALGKSEVEGIPFRVADGAPYWLQVAGESWIRVDPGDLILLPHGDAHVMASDPDVPVEALADGFSRLGLQEWVAPGRERADPRVMSFGGPGSATIVVGGILVFRDLDRIPLLKVLPRLIHIQADRHPMLARLGAALQALLDEAKDAEPGWNIAVSRLAEVIFVQALRAYFALRGQAASGWFEALRDPKIGKALLLMHRDLARAWTVESLAMEVGMSRSRFAARFSELVGKTPVAYISSIRLARAAEELAAGASVAAAAGICGYASEKAFARAFRNWSGDSPSHYRRQNASTPSRHR